MRRKKTSILEAILHPYANFKRIQHLDRLPDRRISKHQRHPVQQDPLRAAGQASAIYKALGLYAQEESRIELYENYREMDYDSVISSVLDAFGEEAAQLDPEHGRVVWVEARNTEIQRIVLRCLDRVQADQRAFPICRTAGRDGDVFMHNAAARGEGVIALRAYQPWQVARIEDDIGRLTGFAPADDRGNPSKSESHSVPFYKVLHFRLPARDLEDIYGASASFLWGARIKWRMLQLMLDQVVIQRLLRRPDRISILVDTAGMSHDDAHWFIEDLKRRMHREWHLNPDGGGGLLGGGGPFGSTGNPLDGAQDFVLPKGPQNGTQLENFPATNQNDLLRDVELFYRELANGIGFPHGFIGMVEGRYNPEQSLSRQHQPFAKRASRLQRAFLHEMVRLCMIDMAYQGLDPTKEEHQFSLQMAPVSPILELERHEVIQMKLDRLERALRMGIDNQFNQDFWVPFVLRTYGGFPDDVIESLYQKKDAGQPEQHHASSAAFAFESNGKNGNGKVPDQRALREAMEEKIRRHLPPTGEPKVLSESTSGVFAAGHSPDEFRSSNALSIDEWVTAPKDVRSRAVKESLQDTHEPGTSIKPLNDDEAKRFKTRIFESRAKVMKNLVLSGNIFKTND